MNRNREYKDKVYKDAGVERGVAAKAMTVIIALILALVLTLTSCGSTAEAGSAGGVTSQTSTEASYNAASKSATPKYALPNSNVQKQHTKTAARITPKQRIKRL